MILLIEALLQYQPYNATTSSFIQPRTGGHAPWRDRKRGHDRAKQSNYHLQQEEILRRERRAGEAQVQHRDSPNLVLASLSFFS